MDAEGVWTAFALVVLCAARSGSAQIGPGRPLTPPPEFTVDQWTTVNGLPQNSVNAIAQTPDGYIWLGTFGGLARFDGLRFNVVERVDSAGRHVDRVLSLAVAPDSTLWIGTENGLLRYCGGQFRLFTTANGLPDNEVRALYFDHAGTLWIGTEHGGAARYQAGRFTAIHDVKGVPFSAVSSFVEDRSGIFWINARGHFLPLVSPGVSTERLPEIGRAPFDVLLLEDQKGDEWFRVPEGTGPAGMGRVRPGGVDLFRMGFGPEVMIEQDRPGRYWLGTFQHGVIEFRPDDRRRATPYPLAEGNMSYGTRALLNGHDGNVWVGTARNGLLRLKRNLFTTYRAANGLSLDIITTVMEARDGSLWVGTNCGGVNVIDPARETVHTHLVTHLGELGSDPCVFAMAQDSDGVVWVGTYGGGLTRIQNERAERVGGLGVLRDSVILALFTSRDGTLWVGTNAAGLARVRGRQVQRVYTTTDGLANNSVRHIAQTRDGAIWVGTLGGLSRLAPDGQITTYTAKNGLSSEYVRSTYEDDDGTLWIGTYGGGLNRFRNGHFVAITRADGLADNVVSSILDDDRGNLWMSGNLGIYRVTKAQLNQFADGRLRRVHSVLYGVGDGLVNAETNGGFQPAGWKDHTGRLWFPTIEGLASVDPMEATDIPRPPPVTVDEIDVDGEPRAAGKPLEIGPGRPNVEFRYTAVSLSAPDNVTFRYRLEGLDDNWVEPGTRRIAYYSRLPAGHYRFVVTAANRDGVWNPSTAALNLVVLAPLYRRPWFIVGVLLIGALALLMVHQAVLHTRGEAIRDERSRLAREIHDSLLQGFGGIALELDAASARLSLPPSQQPLLDRVLALIDRTLTQARQAVWDIRPAGLAAADFAIECRAAGERILGGTETQYRVVTHGRARRLTAVCQTECLRIIEEALTNVRKHAAARHVVVLLRYGWFHFRVTVRDNGQGFDPDRDGTRRGHWGLLGMRERASRFGARLALESRPGAGTVITVDGPYSLGFLTRPGVTRKD